MVNKLGVLDSHRVHSSHRVPESRPCNSSKRAESQMRAEGTRRSASPRAERRQERNDAKRATYYGIQSGGTDVSKETNPVVDTQTRRCREGGREGAAARRSAERKRKPEHREAPEEEGRRSGGRDCQGLWAVAADCWRQEPSRGSTHGEVALHRGSQGLHGRTNGRPRMRPGAPPCAPPPARWPWQSTPRSSPVWDDARCSLTSAVAAPPPPLLYICAPATNPASAPPSPLPCPHRHDRSLPHILPLASLATISKFPQAFLLAQHAYSANCISSQPLRSATAFPCPAQSWPPQDPRLALSASAQPPTGPPTCWPSAPPFLRLCTRPARTLTTTSP